VDDPDQVIQPDAGSHRERRKELVRNRKGRFVRRRRRLERPSTHINGNGASSIRRSAVARCNGCHLSDVTQNCTCHRQPLDDSF
jgi:hypothetical protein